VEQGVEVAFAVCSSGLGLVLVLAGGLACGFGLGFACGDAVRVRLLELSASISSFWMRAWRAMLM
jgi:hypothetical protein